MAERAPPGTGTASPENEKSVPPKPGHNPAPQAEPDRGTDQPAPGVVFSVDLAPRENPANASGSADAPASGQVVTRDQPVVSPANTGTGETRVQEFFAPFAAIDQNAMRLVVGVPMILLAVIVFWGAWRTSDRKIKRDLERMQGRGDDTKPTRKWS